MNTAKEIIKKICEETKHQPSGEITTHTFGNYIAFLGQSDLELLSQIFDRDYWTWLIYINENKNLSLELIKK